FPNRAAQLVPAARDGGSYNARDCAVPSAPRVLDLADCRHGWILNQSLKCKICRQKSFAAASLTLMPSPTDPSERIAEVLREILFLTTERSSPAAPETKKEKDSKTTSSEPEQEPKS